MRPGAEVAFSALIPEEQWADGFPNLMSPMCIWAGESPCTPTADEVRAEFGASLSPANTRPNSTRFCRDEGEGALKNGRTFFQRGRGAEAMATVDHASLTKDRGPKLMSPVDAMRGRTTAAAC